jgi:hypothetical protein
LKEFWGNFNQMFIFVNQASADNLQFLTETPSLDKIKRKMIMVVKTRQMKSEEFLDANISKDIMMMEMNRSILENLFLVCQVSYDLNCDYRAPLSIIQIKIIITLPLSIGGIYARARKPTQLDWPL